MSRVRLLALRRALIISLKFGGTTALSLWFASQLTPLDLLSCGFVAVLTLQPSLFRGLRDSLDQVLASLIATAVSVLVVFALRLDPSQGFSLLGVSVGVGITAVICLQLLRFGATATALFTVLYLFTMPVALHESFWATLHLRALTVVIAVATSTAANLLTSWLRHANRGYLDLLEVATRGKELLLATEETLSARRNQPEDDRIRELMAPLRAHFRRLNELHDASVQEEAERRRMRLRRGGEERNRGEKSAELCQYMQQRVNNLAHFHWNVLLSLLHFQISEERYRELTERLSEIVLRFRRAHRALESRQWLLEGAPEAGPGAQGLAEQLAALGQGTVGEELFGELSLISDLAHMCHNVVEFERLVGRYLALQTGATATAE